MSEEKKEYIFGGIKTVELIEEDYDLLEAFASADAPPGDGFDPGGPPMT